MSNITAETLLDAFPYPLKGTGNIYALAAIAAEAIEGNLNAIPDLNIYGVIDRLPGELLDMLAYDFKVDWWDPDADIEVKRRVFYSAMDVHRRLGTSGAVQTAIKSVFDSAQVTEWYEYNGLPYHYKLTVDLGESEITTEKIRRLLDRARFYVNLRSVLDGVTFATTKTERMYLGAAQHITHFVSAAVTINSLPIEDDVVYTDELGLMLADENSDLIILE